MLRTAMHDDPDSEAPQPSAQPRDTVLRDVSLPALLRQLEEAEPGMYRILLDSPTVEASRENLYHYLNKRERTLRNSRGRLHPIEHATARQCLRVLKNVLARRSESLAGFSTLEYLRQAVQNTEDTPEVDDGFILEFIHLGKGLNGQSGLSDGWLGPSLAADEIQMADSSNVKGQSAGIARSNYLDQMARNVWSRVKRHPTGLDPKLIAERKQNKQRIIDFFDATPEHWDSYAWQLARIFKGPEALPRLDELVPLTTEDREAIQLCVENGIPFGITPHYLSLFDFESANRERDAQVRSQVIPPTHYVKRMLEHREDREYYFDFMGEHDTSPTHLVTRRYPAVAILKAYDTCPQICVYCQRNWEITGPMEAGALPSKAELDTALDWFASHTNLRDVLVTGGDPFFLSNKRIEYILERLAAMEHIVHIRWGTRAPITVPMRVTDELAQLLGRYVDPGRRNVGVVTHVQSAAEVTPDVAEAVSRLRRQGIYVYNQQVFTLQTSLRFQTVANRIALKEIGVDPYYTFYPKGKEETTGYTTPLARVLQERKEEARLLPGSFRTDEPVFNVPRLGKSHVRARQDRELIAIRPNGRRVYLWHPWEKGITPVKPWLYTDQPISTYLRQIGQMGENPEDYKSIWFYY